MFQVASKISAKFMFVDPLPDKASNRSKELQDAEIKSHAAYISHQSRRQRSPKTFKVKLKCNLKPTFRLYGNEQKHDHPANSKKPAQSKRNAIRKHQASASPSMGHQNIGTCQTLNTEYDKLWSMLWQLEIYPNRQISRFLKIKCVVTEDFFKYMADEAMFHAGSAYLYHGFEGAVKSERERSMKILKHSTKAMEIIRKRLSRSEILDNATLLAILALPFSEDHVTSVDSFRAHWNALARLLRIRLQAKSIEHSPGGSYLNDVIEGWADLGAIWLGLSAPLERNGPTRPPFPLSMSPSALNKLPTGIRRLLRKGKIGIPACRLAINLADLLGPNAIQPQHNELSFFVHYTWHMSDVKPSSIQNEPSIEMVVCHALEASCLRLVKPRAWGAVAKSIRWQLTTSLQQCLTPRAEEEEHALFWAFTVGIDLWKTNTDDLSTHGVLLRDLQVDRFSSSMLSDMSREILGEFFCDDELIEFRTKLHFNGRVD